MVYADLNGNGVIDPATEIIEENNYYPFGLKHKGYNELLGEGYKYKYNGKELQDELGLNMYDYGARNYDPALGRWNRIDNKAEIYYALTPYNYAGNTPVQAIDVDGNLFIFVNGFMMNQWMAGQRPEYINIAYDSKHRVMSKNPHYSKYAPDRGFYKDGARNNGKTFRYWSIDQNGNNGYGVNNFYQDAYGDYNAYYTNGSFTPNSTAKTRFAEGAKAAADLIEKLESGDISLTEGETIKIVGHSQGAAYAAGLATELLKHSVYGSRIEFVDYIAAHQPTDFESPKGLLSRQFLTWSDWVVDGIMSDLGLNGGSENGCIKNVTDCQERKSHRDGRGGHSVNTYLDYIADYFKNLGIPVTVTE